jgi:predicted amidohydrolase
MIERRTFLAGVVAGGLSMAQAGGTADKAAETRTGKGIAAAGRAKKMVKVAAVQCPSDLGEIGANTRRLSKLVETAAASGAKFVVLPETSISGYVSQDMRTNWQLPGWPIEKVFASQDPRPFAQTVPGPATDHFCKLAKKLGIYLTIPLLENAPGPTTDEPKLFNTVCLAAPTGELVAHYRKLTPWPFPEQSWATPGDRGVQTYDTEYGRVGLAICFDIHTILERYEPHQLWALLYPIAWVDDDHPAEWFWHSLPARLKPFHHYLIGANWSVDKKPKNNWKGYGFSTILAPDGQVLATAKSLFGEEIVYAEIEPA